MTMRAGLALLVVALGGLTGCHSAYVEAAIVNRTAQPATLVELDYPSASFGTQTLASGATYTYRFKILGDGPTKLLWTDTTRVERHSDGPALREGQEGRLTVTLTPGGVEWQPALSPR